MGTITCHFKTFLNVEIGTGAEEIHHMNTDKSIIGNSITFIAFGITGDLMKQKILPALFQLHLKKNLPKRFHIIGISRQAWNQKQLQTYITEVIRAIYPTEHGVLSSFLELFQFFQGDINDKESYTQLKKTLADHDTQLNACTNKLFYLAIGPKLHESTLSHLILSGIIEKNNTGNYWTRIIIEKPFGNDLTSAKRLEALIEPSFKEEQVYRADHYLLKKTVHNILDFRFVNNLFESRLNNEYVKHIHIKLLEDVGVEKRAAFYDGVGALRDMGQSHLLEILALFTMEKPASLEATAVRTRRAEILEMLVILSSQETPIATFRAQYQGYRDIEGVAPDSQTETYFKIQATLSSPRWRGVPIFLESGKRLGHPLKEVSITFKPIDLNISSSHGRNNDSLIFPLELKENQAIYESKESGARGEAQQEIDLFWSAAKGVYTEYERLILDCIGGNQTLFVSIQEVMATWRYIDPIVAMWQKNLVPLNIYPQGTERILEESKYIENIR